MNFKQKTPRDSAYLAWIRTQRCIICGRGWSIEAHHAGAGGMGIKCSDHKAVPLCVTCHSAVHRSGRKDGIPNLEQALIRLRDNYKAHNEPHKEK